jgi:hypothetical protein
VARKPRPPPWASPSCHWQVRRVVPQRAQPGVVPSAPGANVGRSAAGVEVLKGPRRPLVQALGHQQQVWRESVPARLTATGGARHG